MDTATGGFRGSRTTQNATRGVRSPARAGSQRTAGRSNRVGTASRRGATATRSANANHGFGYRAPVGRAARAVPRNLQYHSYYRRHGYHCNWHFGYGRYYGCRFYYPYYNYCSGRHFAFFYPLPVTFVYAPYGFYDEYEEPVYVTRKEPINDDYEPERYDAIEEEPAPEKTDGKEPEKKEDTKEVEPEPAADSPTTEKFLREASDAFGKADYEAAAKKFRLAAISAPEKPAPLFALGQSLIALGKDNYAARVIRRAVLLSPALLKEPGDIAGVYKSQAEFDRIVGGLKTRAATDQDAQFLLGVQRYFTGDPRCRADFRKLAVKTPDDKVVDMFVKETDLRFKSASGLPPIDDE